MSRRAPRHWAAALRESASLAIDSVRTQPARSLLAIVGIVIGIVTVVLVASVLANLRNQVALLFRELGTENIFAFHLTGDPYATPSEAEARRLPLKPSFAAEIARDARAVRAVAVQVIVPTIVGNRALTARSGDRESDTRAGGRGVAELLRDRRRRVRVGPSLHRPRRPGGRAGGRHRVRPRPRPVRDPQRGRPIADARRRHLLRGWGDRARKGGFFGENRQDSVLAIPAGTVKRRFPDIDRVVLYARARPGMREDARREIEASLRRLRRLSPDEPNDFTLSTADSIIRTLDGVSAQVGLVTVLLAAVSLFIGGIGIANVQIISAKERTREIGVRLAIGAPRRDVLNQFLFEAAILSSAGGLAGVLIAVLVGLILGVFVSGFSALPPLWAVAAGLLASLTVGIVAGYWPARQAAALDPVEALRYE